MKRNLTNREKSTLLTIIASFLPSILIMILGAVKTKYIILYLGSNANGVYQFMIHFSSLVVFGNLGLSSIFKISYYKSIASDDRNKTTEIYNYSNIFFKRTTIIMLVISVVLSVLAPFFLKSDLPLREIIVLQFLVCFPNVLNFYIGKELTLLSARQKEYIYLSLYNGIYILRLVLSLFIIKYINSLFTFLSVDMIITSLSYLLIKFIVKKDNKVILTSTNNIDKTPLKSSKYIIPSNISNTVYFNIDTILISYMISSFAVSIYTAYIYIANCVVSLEKYIISSLTNSLGNLYNSKDDYKEAVTNEIILLSTFIILLINVPLTIGMDSFVSKIWINDINYVLDTITYVLICVYFVLYSIRLISNLFEESIGSYKETYVINVLQAVLNIVFSIILCQLFGIKGTIFATILILAIFEITKIKKSLKCVEIRLNAKYFYVLIGLSLIEVVISMYLRNYIFIGSILDWIVCMIFVTFISIIINFVIYYILFKDFRALVLKFRKSSK